MVVLELAADEMMAIKPAGQTTGAAAAAGYSAGYGLPIEEERENETGGAMQCKREAGGVLARRKKIKAKGWRTFFCGRVVVERERSRDWTGTGDDGEWREETGEKFAA